MIDSSTNRDDRVGEPRPAVVDRSVFQAELDRLRVREKAHTHEGDAIAAARRRLPMVEIDSAAPLIGPDGPMSLRDAFDGRRLLIAYYFMWNSGRPAAEQCEGCTWVTSQVTELYETYWTTGRGVEAMDYSLALMDLTAYGRQQSWEDSPRGWPVNDELNSTNGRPEAQWSRLKAGRSDDLTAKP